MIAKLLNLIKARQYHIFMAVCIILISFISYNIGKINSGTKNPLKITESANIYKASAGGEQGTGDAIITPKTSPKPLDMRVVVSKASDSKKYHYTWCSSWKKIKPENQIWFNSDKEAEAAGYTLAGNCTK
jgi:hypothetical protein